jgi:hypothetical protein
MLQTHIRSIHENLIQRIDEALKTERDKQEGEREKWEEALEVERAKREEALKAERQKREEALKVERQKQEEALKVERQKQEEALKVALKTEREKREEALKVALKAEREKREEALKVEREEREREKAEADKKYGLLKNHLLEVEETTMDTVGWIANNVGYQLFSFCMKTDCVKNRIRKCLTESSYAIYSTKRRKYWLLPPD